MEIKDKILQGFSLEVLKTLPDESVDMCLTSPPYWALRDYGTGKWEGGSVDCKHSKLKYNNTSFSERWGGKSSNKHSVEIVPYKDECPDCGAKRVDKQLGLEKTPQEYVNRLCDIFDEVKRVLKPTGTCWVNIGDSYNCGAAGNKTPSGPQQGRGIEADKATVHIPKTIIKSMPPKCLVQIPSRFAIEMTNRGWVLRNEIIWYKSACMPSPTKDRFTVDFEKIYFFSKNGKYYFKQQLEPMASSSEQRAKYAMNLERFKQKENLDIEETKKRFYGNGQRNKRCVWKLSRGHCKDAHFAVYSEDLCETPIKAGCPPEGIVIDPFFGSGTTGVVALKQNKHYIGIELNPEYVKIAEARLSAVNNNEIAGTSRRTLTPLITQEKSMPSATLGSATKPTKKEHDFF